MFEANSIISSNIDRISKDEDPEGKCDDWNDQLATIFSDYGWEATVVAEPKVTVKGKNGEPIGHHAITVAYSPQNEKWVVADLSAAQIENMSEPFVYSSDNFVDVAAEVRSTFGGSWKGLNNSDTLLADAERRKSVLEYRKKLKEEKLAKS